VVQVLGAVQLKENLFQVIEYINISFTAKLWGGISPNDFDMGNVG
jgi:hypothetical protein